MAKILVIDDEELARYTVVTILRSAGHEVSEAENGDWGLRQLRSQPADLVITDIIMPEKEGIGTILELKQRHPHVKIVAMSGGGRTVNLDYLGKAQKLGAHAAIAKPFTKDELLTVVAACLDGG